MKEVLIITNYYPPETGAASNRICHLAEGLSNNNCKVTVVTPLPNYPTGKIFKGYRNKFKKTSEEEGIKIVRLWIFASVSKNKFLRLIAMLSYSFSLVWFFVFSKIPKTVIVQSPPLLVACTSLFFLKSRKRNLILNVSDLWPLAGLKLQAFEEGFVYNLLKRIEKSNYKKADLLLGQSQEILMHVHSIFPNKNTFIYRNYPDFSFQSYIKPADKDEKIKIVYAGLLGIAQGVLKLCHELDFSNIEFHIYGDGAEKNDLIAFLNAHPELPIIYHGEVSREKLHQELIQYDVAIIPLLKRIYGSVPSKIFEYSRLGLPIIYFGGGEGEDIIKQYKLGWVAEASNYSALNAVISDLIKDELTDELRKGIIETSKTSFNFEIQLKKLIKKL